MNFLYAYAKFCQKLIKSKTIPSDKERLMSVKRIYLPCIVTLMSLECDCLVQCHSYSTDVIVAGNWHLEIHQLPVKRV